MRGVIVLSILSAFGTLSCAEVIRCADAAGNVSYTDAACPPGARPVSRVEIPPPADMRNADAGRPIPLPRANLEAAAPVLQAPSGPVIIDSRAGPDRPTDSRRSDRGDDDAAIDDDYAYPRAYPQPRPPRDLRPRIRNCDATGCRDTQGNHYDRSGQLDRYRSLDGKTCRPVGTTTICR
ncbi:DUF4124 domain-containing protein [Variovorax soli]|uniref:DUF4124 domain-containing protein n=1 Tax=Variovorax soli TaxID=376815 RepID=A0ABU1NN68_9BURK|nr:DUF4124 domain-containing protein [Variovorax soli]MDR6539326.1 hypothetical protein [Variovorax soli]